VNVRIAILGAGGFIGSHLVEYLVARAEHEVTGLDITRAKLKNVNGDSFTFVEADIRKDDRLLDETIERADLVVDLVAYANPSMYVLSPLEVFDLNFSQNLKVAERCVRHRKRLIQYSSAEVYGKVDRGASLSEETTDLILGPTSKQRWIYSAAKGLLERVLHAYGLSGALSYTIVRPFNFVGSRLDYIVPPGSRGGPRVFPHFMSALISGGPIRLVDGGHYHRAFLHINDGNEAFQALLENPRESHNQIFNVGNPDNNLTIRELATLMIELYEELTESAPRSQIETVRGDEFYGEGYEDSDRLLPDIRKMGALGWKPKIGLRETFRAAMKSYLDDLDSGATQLWHSALPLN
jgi:UDP-apiose/xylose synthase